MNIIIVFIFRPHRCAWAYDADHCYRCSVVCVCVCVCLLVTIASCAKTAETTDMSCGLWTPGDPSNRVLDDCPDSPTVGGTSRGRVKKRHAQTCPQSIFSTVFAKGQQRCGLWLPACCGDLFTFVLHTEEIRRQYVAEFTVKTNVACWRFCNVRLGVAYDCSQFTCRCRCLRAAEER